MDVLTFAVIFGFIGASFATYASRCCSPKYNKKTKEEALKRNSL